MIFSSRCLPSSSLNQNIYCAALLGREGPPHRGANIITRAKSYWIFLPSQVKSWTSTSWIGISFKKKGFKQRGFPLTILFFLSHFPSQAKWQLQLKELASKLLKGNTTWFHYTWTYRNTEITTERWGAPSPGSFLCSVPVRPLLHPADLGSSMQVFY